MPSSSVLIAGAGPAGLVSALVLADAGVSVTVLERNGQLVDDIRASTFHPPTLDLLNRYGLAQPLIAQGLIARYVQQRDRSAGLVAQFDMDLLAGDTQHPFRLQCEQWRLTRILAERLGNFPHVRIIWNAQLQSVSQSGEGVTVQAVVEGTEATFTAGYLIGADGAWSTVRQELGIEFEGFTYPERFLVVSTEFDYMKPFPDLCWVNYVSDPEEWCVLLRAGPLWRVLFPTRVDETDEDVMAESAIQSRMRNLMPKEGGYATIHRTLYKVHQRVAKRFRQGRVFLAGDAAHINNPIGGMGMNGAVQDAFNLTGKLVRVINEGADDALLDRYERQRRTVAIEYINANTQRNKKNLEERDPVSRQRNIDELRATAADPARARAYLIKTSMIDALQRAEAIE